MNNKLFRTLVLSSLLNLIFICQSFAQDALWICASTKTEIPSGYYVKEIAKDLTACSFPKQNMLIIKVKSDKFWICNFQNMGAPTGYVVVEESKVSTCGCQTPARDGTGKVYCFGSQPEGKQGWPEVAVHKLSEK